MYANEQLSSPLILSSTEDTIIICQQRLDGVLKGKFVGAIMSDLGILWVSVFLWVTWKVHYRPKLYINDPVVIVA